MPNTVILTTNLPASLSAVPNQNTTLSVVASANFPAAAYTYQWKNNGSNISGATSSSYFFEPSVSATYTCLVSALSSNGSANVAQAYVLSNGVVFSVLSTDTGKFSKWTPKLGQPNLLNESGEERFKRMRNMGYC